MSRRAEAAAAAAPPRPHAWEDGRLVWLLLIIGTVLAYQQVWHAGFVWDDNGHVTRPDLRPVSGLWRIWAEPGATQQYYPVLHSAFWLEHRLWGDSAPCYHLLNVLLHLGVTFLLYRVLRRLLVPGALLAASIFALHPVCVESVAWISEEKNTLASLFYLAAALAYLRFDERRRPAWYGLGVLLFGLALLSKSVTATLPAALLVVFWWKRGRLSLKGDVLPLAPWFCMSAAAAAMTIWMERTHIGANGAAFGLSLAGRLLVAGRAAWFYLGKILWPAGLTFIYPHWSVDARAAWQWLPPAAALAAFAFLFAMRGRSRAPLACALLFIGTLFPALGFIDAYPFMYSYVADHFQYLAAAVVISGAAAGLTLAAGRLPSGGRPAAVAGGACVAAFLAALTWRQCAMYSDMETLWLATIARNPDCWMAHNNLGIAFVEDGRLDEAVAHYERALDLNPGFAETHNNLGIALVKKGRADRAIAEFRRALLIRPGDVQANNNLGNALLHAGRTDEAVAAYERAIQMEPNDAEAHNSLGYVARVRGRMDEALSHYRRASEIEPNDAAAQNNLGNAFLGVGRVGEAVAQYRRALALDPDYVETYNNLGAALLKEGRAGEAVAVLQRALALGAASADAHFNLGNALAEAGRLDEAIVQYEKALEINPNDAEAHRSLGAALFRKGRVDEAITHYNEASQLR